MATSDNKWQQMVQPRAASGTSNNEWKRVINRVTTNENEWQWMITNDSEDSKWHGVV